MNPAAWGALGLAALCGCGARVELAIGPVTQSIPIFSVGVDSFAEVAVDIPAEARGNVTLLDIGADLAVDNLSVATPMTLSLRLSQAGTAAPGVAYLFTGADKPAYFNGAAILLPDTPFAPATRTAEHLSSAALADLLRQPRAWFIVGSRVTTLGSGDGLPLVVVLENAVIHATVTKSLGSLSGAAELGGL